MSRSCSGINQIEGVPRQGGVGHRDLVEAKGQRGSEVLTVVSVVERSSRFTLSLAVRAVGRVREAAAV